MKKYEIISGIEILIDDDISEDEILRYNWHASRINNIYKIYTRVNGKEKTFRQLILGIDSIRTRFKNGNSLDLRRENLILYDTMAEFLDAIRELRNIGSGEFNSKISSASQGRRTHGKRSSKYIGVRMVATPRKWYAAIKHNGKIYHLGSYEKEKDAALAYDKRANELYGKDARLNFPRLTYEEIAEKLEVIQKENEVIFHENLSRRHQGRRFEIADKTSKYIGVCRNGKSTVKPWRSTICYQGKQYHLGSFKTEIEAAQAYDLKAIEFYGETARLNLPYEK